jgi:HAD superfamily hydrolase (TIGR01509 family)
VRAVLFDLDGVLIDSYETWFHLTAAAARAHGCPPVTPEAYRACWGQSVAKDAEVFLPGHSFEQLDAYNNAHHHEHLHHTVRDPAALEVLAALRARGVLTAVCTNTPQPLAGQILDHLGLHPDVRVAETDVAHPKPAPDMLLRALDLLGVSAEDAWMVGDSRFDAAAAAAAGVRFAGVRRDGLVRLEDLADVLTRLT